MSDTLKVIIAGESRELFMSFGLLNALSGVLGNAQEITGMSMDPVLRTAIIEVVLAERDDDGQVLVPFKVNGARALSAATAATIIDWVTEHLLDFFIQALTTSQRLQVKNERRLRELTSSLVGSAT